MSRPSSERLAELSQPRDMLREDVADLLAEIDALQGEVRQARGEAEDARADERETYVTMRAIDADRCRLADEVDALRAPAALGAELLAEARADVAFYESRGMGAHCPAWPRPLAARIVKRAERLTR